ncbi:MAG TPA: HAD family hydrolase [Chloroflexia bacterium]|nr:HAD family hydrolase [Chloroflexia bacterium]
MLKAVLFDMGDTLLQRQPADGRARAWLMNTALHTAIAARYPAVPLPSPAALDAQLAALNRRHHPVHTRDQLLEHLVAATRWPLDPHDPDLLTAWHQPLIASSHTERDLPRTLAALQALGLRLAIISNTQWRGPWRDQELAQNGIVDYFPVRIYSADLQIEKPDARIFAAALAALPDVAPAEAIYVGDNLQSDVGGAHAAGLWTAWLAPLGVLAPPADIPVLPDLVLTGLHELPDKLVRQFALPRATLPGVGG